MRIDLHCHTKKVKTGDAYTRNVTKDKFFQKVIEAEVKIVAITNHNQFDYTQYKEFKDVTEGYIMIEAVDNVYLAVKKFSTGLLATKDLNTTKSTIYPNPSNGQFTIEQKASGKVNIEIVDVNGRIVYSISENASGNLKKQIDTNLPSGVYIIKVSSNEGQSTSKLIIK